MHHSIQQDENIRIQTVKNLVGIVDNFKKQM